MDFQNQTTPHSGFFNNLKLNNHRFQVCAKFKEPVGVPKEMLVQSRFFDQFLALPTKAYQGKDIVFRFIIEYSSLRDFGPGHVIGLFLYEDV
jgi:hypothetical protein